MGRTPPPPPPPPGGYRRRLERGPALGPGPNRSLALSLVAALVLLGVALLFAGCGSWPPWKPPTEPTPPPPCQVGDCDRGIPEACVDGACVPCEPDLSAVPDWMDVPPPSCSTDERPVKHFPPDVECPLLTDPCAPPPPLPEPQCPTFTDRGGTLRVLGDACDCYLGHDWQECPPPPTACVDESNLVAVSCPMPGADFQDEVKQATDTLGDLRGRPPNENLDKLAAQLRVQMPGRCVLSGIEAVFILRDDGTFEENHAVFFGNGSWTNSGRGRFIGCHRDESGPPPPVDPPPGAVVCEDPELTGIRHKLKLHCPGSDPGRKWCDVTPTLGGCEFCTAIGLGCMPGSGPEPPCTPRCDCPPRQEGHPERHDCESVFFGWPDGPPTDPIWTSDGQVVVKSDNRSRAYTPNGSWIRVCTAGGVCSQVGP